MKPNISVCMAIKNGEGFLHEQLNTILPQLAGDDEVIISDDHSTDNSVTIVRSFDDSRIKLIHNPSSGIISNFENALRAAVGKYIFLADQDDVWLPEKVRHTLSHLLTYDLVVSDCVIVDERLRPVRGSFFGLNRSGKGIFKNLFHNSYMGSCMAFHRKVVEKALPFPARIPMHDIWLGLTSEIHFRVKFIDEKLVLHRLHQKNASTTSRRSRSSLGVKIEQRFWLMKGLLEFAYAS